MGVRVVVAMDFVDKRGWLSGNRQYGDYSSRGWHDEHVVQVWCTFGAHLEHDMEAKRKEKSWASLNGLYPLIGASRNIDPFQG